MKSLTVSLLLVASFAAAQSRHIFTGVITDELCAASGHSSMAMGPTDGTCTRECVVAHDAQYVLLDGKAVYLLDNQKTPERFAGERVQVTGVLDAKTNTSHVQSIARAK